MIEKNKKNSSENYYDHQSEIIDKVDNSERALALHFGYFTNKTKTLKKAILQMNDFVFELLDIDNNDCTKLLDCGCGVGGTSLYLAKKYPKVFFVGITNSRKQIKLARFFAKEREIKNADFMYGDYLNTVFPDNEFDGIFALESVCYAKNHQAFISEMHRILKPGGRLVIVDSFRTHSPLNYINRKFYRQFCESFGITSLEKVTKYKDFLKEKGFTKIYIRDISKSVRPSVFYFSIKAFPHLIKMIKNLLIWNKDDKYKPSYFDFRGNLIFAGICGALKIIAYYGISAVKKS